MKKLILSAAFLMCGTLMFSQNISTVHQSGNGNDSDVNQVGNLNSSTVYQNGDNNDAVVEQNGISNDSDFDDR